MRHQAPSSNDKPPPLMSASLEVTRTSNSVAEENSRARIAPPDCGKHGCLCQTVSTRFNPRHAKMGDRKDRAKEEDKRGEGAGGYLNYLNNFNTAVRQCCDIRRIRRRGCTKLCKKQALFVQLRGIAINTPANSPDTGLLASFWPSAVPVRAVLVNADYLLRTTHTPITAHTNKLASLHATHTTDARKALASANHRGPLTAPVFRVKLHPAKEAFDVPSSSTAPPPKSSPLLFKLPASYPEWLLSNRQSVAFSLSNPSFVRQHKKKTRASVSRTKHYYRSNSSQPPFVRQQEKNRGSVSRTKHYTKLTS